MSRCSNSPSCHHDPECEDLDCPGRPDTAPAQPAADRVVNLQVNTTGAWRNVLRFEVADEAEVLHTAAALFGWDKASDVRLRVIVPGDAAPLMNWTRERGWREWRAV